MADSPYTPLVEGDLQIKHKTGGWKACLFILATELCEKLGSNGLYINMVVYMTTVMHQGNASAARSVMNWYGTSYISSFVGAFFADSYFGRYWTIATLSTVYSLTLSLRYANNVHTLLGCLVDKHFHLGMVLLAASASLPWLKPSSCNTTINHCQDSSFFQMAFFYTALYTIAIGAGGIKPCVSSFGADQFNVNDPVERAHMASFFNWYYFIINVGALLASTVVVYIQENVGWGVGFGIPAVAMLLAICTFFMGAPLYRRQKPGGSSLTRIAQVLVAAISKWRVQVPEDESSLYQLPEGVHAIEGSIKVPHSNEFRFLDKAATIPEQLEHQPSPWSLCTVTQVEEVKRVLDILLIWATTIVYFTAFSQLTTFFIEQGQRMDPYIGLLSFKIPSATLIMFDTLSIVTCVPLYEWYVVPFVRRVTHHPHGFTQLQRIGIGLVLATFAMLCAAFVERERLKVAAEFHLLDNVTEPVPMSILWQVPQFAIVGVSEIFTYLGVLEFFYDQSPDEMRSLCSALALSAVALGSYLNSLLVTVISSWSTSWIPNNLNRGHLDYYFLLIGLLNSVNFLFFLVCSSRYKYKKTA